MAILGGPENQQAVKQVVAPDGARVLTIRNDGELDLSLPADSVATGEIVRRGPDGALWSVNTPIGPSVHPFAFYGWADGVEVFAGRPPQGEIYVDLGLPTEGWLNPEGAGLYLVGRRPEGGVAWSRGLDGDLLLVDAVIQPGGIVALLEVEGRAPGLGVWPREAPRWYAVVGFDARGEILWTETVAGGAQIMLHQMVYVPETDTLWVAGEAWGEGTVEIGPTAPMVFDPAGPEGFVVRLRSHGDLVDVFRVTGGAASVTTLGVLDDGAVAVGGSFTTAAAIGWGGPGPLSVHAATGVVPWLARVDAAGRPQWVTQGYTSPGGTHEIRAVGSAPGGEVLYVGITMGGYALGHPEETPMGDLEGDPARARLYAALVGPEGHVRCMQPLVDGLYADLGVVSVEGLHALPDGRRVLFGDTLLPARISLAEGSTVRLDRARNLAEAFELTLGPW